MADESRSHPAAFHRPQSSPELPSLLPNLVFDASTWSNDVFFNAGSPQHSENPQPQGRRPPNSGLWVPIYGPGYQVVQPHMLQQAFNNPHSTAAPQFAYSMRQGLESSNRPAFVPTPNAHMANVDSWNDEISPQMAPLGVPQQTRAAPRPRKSTKRRKMFEWVSYTPRDAELPAGTTTVDVVKQYPNHITDDDLEELWRLGKSAKDISKMMPQDTHTNGDGEIVSQHHSWIQQKLKRFPRTSAAVAPGSCERQGRSPIPEAGLSWQVSEALNQGERSTCLPIVRYDAPRRSGAEICKLLLRRHPFNSQDDLALDARISIMLAKTYVVPNSTDQPKHEWCVLHEYVMRVMEHHRGLVRRKLPRDSPDTEVDERHARYYDDQSLALVTRWRVETFMRCACAPTAILQLFGIVLKIISVPTEKVSSHSRTRRVIYNCQHPQLLQWRAMARVLYTLIETTETVINGTAAYSGMPAISSAVLPYPTVLRTEPLGPTRSEVLPLASDSSYQFSGSRSPSRLLEGIEETAQIEPQLLETPQVPSHSEQSIDQGTTWAVGPARMQTPESLKDELPKAAWTPGSAWQESSETMLSDLHEAAWTDESNSKQMQKPLGSKSSEVTHIDPQLLAPRQNMWQTRPGFHQGATWTPKPVADEEGLPALQSDTPLTTSVQEPFVQRTPQVLENHLVTTASTDVTTSGNVPAIRASELTSQGHFGTPRSQTYWNHEENNQSPHMADKDTRRDLCLTSPVNMLVDPQDTYLNRLPPTSSPTDDQSIVFDLDNLIPERNDDEWLDEWSLPNDYMLQ